MKRKVIVIISILGIVICLFFVYKRKIINAFPSENSSSVSPIKSSPSTVNQIKIFLIALDDQSNNGEKIGCGDKVVPVLINKSPTDSPLNSALKNLLSVKESTYGQSGLYNALYQSDIILNDATFTNGKAIIKLNGDLKLGGICDNPRVEAQLTQTILQFPEIKEAIITLNGKPLKQALSLK